eukprot:CAMPEP_0119313052 /NCGR_PEP_ID=MMETSP1333-20130426/27702_1 /TAXON_ID=418940 /ORGANISM="Scyphosphaera apsteinii, Strain RCC1455" /LENGTH=180 /DNA_ID=CAMNT_0007317785 /DNA_START=62 /DNA_END=604 /DNA_ORIENTATION=+
MIKSITVTSLSADSTTELLRNFFTFHGKIQRVEINGSVAAIEFADASAARSALLFDKASFMGQTIGVSLCSMSLNEGAAQEASAVPSGIQKSKADRSEEDFEKVEHPEAANISKPESHTSTPSTDARSLKNASTMSAGCERTTAMDRAACFEQVLREPINGIRQVVLANFFIVLLIWYFV